MASRKITGKIELDIKVDAVNSKLCSMACGALHLDDFAECNCNYFGTLCKDSTNEGVNPKRHTNCINAFGE